MTTINPQDSLRRFLRRFPHKKFTIQVLLDQNREGTVVNTPHFKSKKFVQEKYPDAEKSKTSHAFTYTELTTDKKVLRELVNVQKSGRAVWWMVNEGDGQLQLPVSPNCVSQKNVTKLTACFIDTDDCPLEDVKLYLRRVKLKPHLVVQSSPGKYHLYFLISPQEPTDKVIDKWRAIQRAFAHFSKPGKITGLDQSMHDVSKVLRLPGFYHLKDKPFQVKIKKSYKHELYTLDELYIKTKASEFLHDTSDRVSKIYELPKEKIEKGARHQAVTEYISSRSNFIEGKDLLFSTYGFIQERIDKPEVFLPGGSRNHEVVAGVDYFVNKRIEESTVEHKKDALELLEKKTSDPFALSKEFYFSAPGIVGEMVKEICSKAIYPAPSFTFATVLAALGTLRANSVTTEYGHAPVNYFLCLGASGVGKAYPQEVLAATFSKLGISRLMENKVRSDRGIIRFLKSNHSVGMLMLDEGEGFLSNLYSAESPSYLRSCKELLLTLYTSNNFPELGFGHVGSQKEEPAVLNYPRLNAVCYGVMHTLENAFTKVSIKDGLLQRFLVVTHYEPRVINPNFKPAKHLSADLLEALKELTGQARIDREKDLVTISDLENEIAASEDDTERNELQAKLDKFLSQRFNKPKERIVFSGKASRVWGSFIADMDKLYNAEIGKASGLEGLYTRSAEQVGRLCAVLATGREIRSDVVEYAIEFVRSRVAALKGYCDENMDRGELGRDIDELTAFIAARINLSGSSAITYREIIRGFRVRDEIRLKAILQAAQNAGTVRMLENYRKPGSQSGRRGTAYALDDI